MDVKETLRLLKSFAGYETHAGYTWALVMYDGALMCERCALANYRQIYRATRDAVSMDDWRAIGLTNSGESEEMETCVQCNKTLWHKDQE